MEELNVTLSGSYILENSFTTAYLKALKKIGFFCYKIPDGSLGIKPFDAVITSDKNTYSVEFKTIDSNIFQVSRLRGNQFSSLNHIHKLGGHPLVIVHKKGTNKYKIIPFNIILKAGYENSIELKFA